MLDLAWKIIGARYETVNYKENPQLSNWLNNLYRAVNTDVTLNDMQCELLIDLLQDACHPMTLPIPSDALIIATWINSCKPST